MYTDATLVDDTFHNAAVYYSEPYDAYIFRVYRDYDTQYYWQGDGYPINEEFLYSAIDNYDIMYLVLELTNAPGTVLFDVSQYLNGIQLTEDQTPYRYVPLSEAIMVITPTEAYQNPSYDDRTDP